MAKFLIMAAYTAEGMDGLGLKGGTARREAASLAVAELGGRLESFYFGFGDEDVYGIVDLPDNAPAVALELAICGSGMARVKTVVLVTPEEVDRAAKLPVTYRVPGT